MPACPDLVALRTGGKAALARALGLIEQHEGRDDVRRLLDEAWETPRAHVIGLTGPPGVGKSTLTKALIDRWRKAGRSVGVIAVDPSSRRSGGALLGDRTRLNIDPEDQGVFVRSMAARERLGGLAGLTFPAMVLMRALFDVVLVETVGVGQSETDVVTVADTVVFCVQPGSGDSLQFMKAGIMEVPDITVVTKADLGPVAERALADVKGALSLAREEAPGGWRVPVLLLSANAGEGIEALQAELSDHWDWLSQDARLAGSRAEQARHWLAESVRERFGSNGLSSLPKGALELGDASPFAREAALREQLAR